ncbi:hypothetical protein PAXRUDRAFT_18115 [Paxillus rubicundulus Ve08.2h10]|uniref:Uncharacterized protein n=1 Tax=Paxillus rubicundulus Ve08.2h10 TaxID=930991 RepID=A0A0D0D888_9AGAM|nr:hypothetical protein PAXRUDRAFT_18115 [Paxillus rubicundulus Ve08.2h10]
MPKTVTYWKDGVNATKHKAQIQEAVAGVQEQNDTSGRQNLACKPICMTQQLLNGSQEKVLCDWSSTIQMYNCCQS